MNPQARVYYEWSRLTAMDQWWQYSVVALAIIAIVTYVSWLYRRDSFELPRGLRWSLLLLRITAFAGLLLFFLNLQKRSEQPIARASRLAVLVDSSLSMTLPAGDAISELSASDQTAIAIDDAFSEESRIEQVIRGFTTSDLLKQLTADHETTIYRFDSSERPIALASLKKQNSIQGPAELESSNSAWQWRTIFIAIWSGTILLTLSVIALATTIVLRLQASIYLLKLNQADPGRRAQESVTNRELNPSRLGYITLASVVGAITAIVLIGAATMRGADYRFATLWNWDEPHSKLQSDNAATEIDVSSDGNSNPQNLDWVTLLAAQGSETRLGDAVASILAREQNAPLAGIVVFTDGQTNAGLSAESAAAQAAAGDVPLFLVGLGSASDPVNVRLVNIDSPRRVFPGDRFRIAATIQASGFSGKSVTVQLRRRTGNSANQNPSENDFTVEQEKSVILAVDGQMNAIDFEVLPPAIGSYTYDVKLLSPPQDANTKDDIAQTDIEVIEPRATVLILAGGPTREYQFVRNLLFRDATIQSHVLLQSGGPGMSQEADELLTQFPSTAEEMAEYDCVLCFDADFFALQQASIDVLEQWVSSGAGGLVLVAGSVDTPEWTGSTGNTDARALKLRDMSPVVLNSRGSRLISLGRFEGEIVWPLVLSSEISGADFLDVANSKKLSQDAWESFAGVYSFYATYQTKPGATPLAYFSDPTTSLDGKLPVYLASQFYGGGRVVFQGSGETWRIRDVDENYFNTYWTKLVRWSAQGRLLRDSDYGLLLTDKEEALLGEQVTVRAVLRNQQFQPLQQSSVMANLIDPSGRLTQLELTQFAGTGQEGVFVGQFLLRQPGKYFVRLDTNFGDGAVLTQQVAARVPTLEIERPKRNDALLATMSQRSGGAYFVGIKNASVGQRFSLLSSNSKDTKTETESTGDQAGQLPKNLPLSQLITSRDQVNFLPGAPDRNFQERWMTVLMLAITAALSLEWLLRRLSRLA